MMHINSFRSEILVFVLLLLLGFSMIFFGSNNLHRQLQKYESRLEAAESTLFEEEGEPRAWYITVIREDGTRFEATTIGIPKWVHERVLCYRPLENLSELLSELAHETLPPTTYLILGDQDLVVVSTKRLAL